MPNMLDDGVATMMSTLLANAGSVCTYTRGASSASVTMYKAHQQPQVVDDGNGLLVEVMMTDFHCNPSALPSGDPVAGDTIAVGGKTYKVLPLVGDKVFYKISDNKIRIHTKQVS